MLAKKCSRIFFLSFFLLIPTVIIFAQDDKEIRLNLFIGGMYGNREAYAHNDPVSYPQKTVEYSIGLECQIPLPNRLGIETGLQCQGRHVYVFPKGQFLDTNNFNAWWNKTDRSFAWLLNLPVRLSYQLPLGDNVGFKFSAGPYVSYTFGPIAYEEIVMDKQNKFQMGLEPSVAFYYKSLNIGARYKLPLYKGYNDHYKNWVEITLGFSFKLKVLESAAQVLSNIDTEKMNNNIMMLQQMQSTGGDSYSSYQQNSHSSSSQVNGKYNVSEQQSYNTAKTSYTGFSSLVSKWRTGLSSYTQEEKRDVGNKMRKIRETWEAKGKSMPAKDVENEKWCFK